MLFKQTFNLVSHDRLAQATITVVAIVSLLSFITFGFLSATTLALAYIGGFFTFQSLFRYRHVVSSLMTGWGTKGRDRFVASSETMNCIVCGKHNCHREQVHHSDQPWSHLYLPEEVDTAVENLLNQILDEFVNSWYQNLSSDSNFQGVLRHSIRYAASVLLSRGLQVEVGRVLTERLIPAAVRHLDTCVGVMEGRPIAFHPALHSRQAELSYLRHITTHVLPLLAPPWQLECKNFSVLIREVLAGWVLLPTADVCADPTVLNSLMWLILGAQPLTQYPVQPQIKQVQFLAAFVAQSTTSENDASALHPDMCTILKDQSLLYAFMQYLKSQGRVHILQFCLDVDEFNRRMLRPELSSDDLDILYRDAWDLYSLYFSPHSPDAIPFPDHLTTQLRKILSKDVSKLQTSPPLFQAYEYAYNMLGSAYCQHFHASDEFYTWLCGPRTPSLANKSGARLRRSQEGGAVARLSSRLYKIKGALKSQHVMEGQTYDLDPSLELEDTEFQGDVLHLLESGKRDMSAWRVSVPSVITRLDPATNKLCPVFSIRVQRIDVTQGESSQWSVERRLGDFYSLEAKLSEFHGEFPDNQLPVRRILSSNALLDTTLYEEYLQRLLSKPALRGSDLLHWFLASPGEFGAEDSALGRLLRRSVPLSLRKERGQNLEPFIATFIASTESRQKNSKIEWKDVTEEEMQFSARCLTDSVFGDNLGLEEGRPMPSVPPPLPRPPLNTPTQCLIFVGVRFFQLSRPLLQLALAMHSLIGATFDALCSSYLERRIHSLLVAPRLAHLISLLQWAIFEPRSPSDPDEVAHSVEAKIQEVGKWSASVYQLVFKAIQHPLMNKQLLYSLLDIMIEEMFPEILDKKDGS